MENVFEFLKKGGIIIYPLILCSILGLTIVIEKILTLRRKRVIVPEIVDLIENIKGPGDIDLALSLCEKHKGPFPNIIRTGLENRNKKNKYTCPFHFLFLFPWFPSFPIRTQNTFHDKTSR